jgi:predicted glycoside hydrolase/deacetylase ChbG (UPF0249 family)
MEILLESPGSERYLIVNADDFGQSHGINRGIVEAHERGIVTSASLMVRWPAVAEAADYARRHPELSLGLHFDLGEWIYRDGEWRSLYQVVATNDRSAVANELKRQLEAFRLLVGQSPSHIDSHQHVHRDEPVRAVASEAAAQLGIPLRECCSHVSYRGGFYGQTETGEPYPEGISKAGLLAMLADLSPGVSELGCHPGDGALDELETAYSIERKQEVHVLCDPQIRLAIAQVNIKLISFFDLNNESFRGATTVLS